MKESKVESEIKAYAESRGCKYLKFTSPAKRSVHDRIIINPHGVTGFLEVKKPDGGIHPKQIRFGRELRNDYKVPVGLVDSVEDGKRFVDWLMTFSLVSFATPEQRYTCAILND